MSTGGALARAGALQLFRESSRRPKSNYKFYYSLDSLGEMVNFQAANDKRAPSSHMRPLARAAREHRSSRTITRFQLINVVAREFAFITGYNELRTERRKSAAEMQPSARVRRCGRPIGNDIYSQRAARNTCPLSLRDEEERRRLLETKRPINLLDNRLAQPHTRVRSHLSDRARGKFTIHCWPLGENGTTSKRTNKLQLMIKR